MADVLDVLTLAEGRAAIGQDPTTTDTAIDTELALYITATSNWCDDIAGAMVSRQIAQCAVNTAATVLNLTGATEKDLEDLTAGQYVDVGTAADPWSIAARRMVTYVDRDNLTVTIDGAAITTTTSEGIRQGRFVDTASVDNRVKMAATAHVRWLWAVERGAASRNFDDFSNVGETLAVPRRILDLLGAYFSPGVA